MEGPNKRVDFEVSVDSHEIKGISISGSNICIIV